MTTTDLPRYLAEWLAHLRTEAAPGAVAIIGPTLKGIEQDVLNPLADAMPQSITYQRSMRTATLLGHQAVLIAARSSDAGRHLRGWCFVSALVDFTDAPHDFWRELSTRLAPGARLFEFSRAPGGPR